MAQRTELAGRAIKHKGLISGPRPSPVISGTGATTAVGRDTETRPATGGIELMYSVRQWIP